MGQRISSAAVFHCNTWSGTDHRLRCPRRPNHRLLSHCNTGRRTNYRLCFHSMPNRRPWSLSHCNTCGRTDNRLCFRSMPSRSPVFQCNTCRKTDHKLRCVFWCIVPLQHMTYGEGTQPALKVIMMYNVVITFQQREL